MGNDPKVAEAKSVLMGIFWTRKTGPSARRTTSTNYRCSMRTDLFDWVVTAALAELVKDGYLVMFNKQNTPELERMGNKIGRMKFYANADTVRTGRGRQLMKKHVVGTAKLVSRYSDTGITRMLGAQLESLVGNQLRISQFEIMGVHTQQVSGKKMDEDRLRPRLHSKKGNRFCNRR